MKDIKFGVMAPYRGDFEALFKNAAEVGVDSIMINITVTDEVRQEYIDKAADIKAYSEKYKVEVNAIWAGWGWPCFWNFYEGQSTIGLVPPEYRDRRFRYMRNASDVAEAWGVKYIVTHGGYIPENPTDPVYISFIAAMKHLCGYYLKPKGQWLCLETGQETPITLLRTIQDIGTENVGLNLDTANLILYGKANPVDALKIVGDYVKCLHLKDGLWPTDGHNLGKQVQIGEGEVNFAEVVKGLNAHGYRGHFTIEREIEEGAERNKDIIEARDMIKSLASQYEWDPE